MRTARASAKSVVQTLFGAVGYAVSKIPDPSGPQFRPREADRHAWLRALGIRTVLDVGAHEGESALEFHEIFPDAFVHSFEPLGDCFRELEAVVGAHPKQRSYRCAIGDVPGTTTIHRSEYSNSSSLLPMAALHKAAYPFSAGERAETVEVRTLDGALAGLAIEPEILLKIDTQGYELRVLAGGAETLRRTRVVVVETSFAELYEGGPRFADVFAYLLARGFVYRGSWDQFASPVDGMPLQQDAIFVRP